MVLVVGSLALCACYRGSAVRPVSLLDPPLEYPPDEAPADESPDADPPDDDELPGDDEPPGDDELPGDDEPPERVLRESVEEMTGSASRGRICV